jgi:maltooligosyltrehalose trehalohydrolase
LHPAERQSHAAAVALHRDLLRLRREDPLFSESGAALFDGAVLADRAFVLRWFAGDSRAAPVRSAGAGDRLLIVNLGADLSLYSAPEPLLAPPAGTAWEVRWSSEDPSYGGMGTAPLETDENWRIPGQAAVLLAAGHR